MVELRALLGEKDLGWQPTESQLVQFERLVEELLRWNQRRNLTAITARDEVIEKHLYDSLTLLPVVGSAQNLLDLGSGAGFPALPLKIACPGLAVVSVDAVAKKIAFQRHAARSLGLEGFSARHARAEELSSLPELRGAFELVTARALGNLDLLVALASPFLAPGGRLVAMKGPEGRDELNACRDRLLAEGWQVDCRDLVLPRSCAVRVLLELTYKS